jgi:hypothetical protein
MRTLRTERDNPAVRLFHYLRRFLLRRQTPSIEAAFLKTHLDRNAERQQANVTGIDPPGFLALPGRHEEIQGGGNRHGESDDTA